MSENKVRIETLRKEKTQESFQNSGITALLLEDFKITLPKDYLKMMDYQIIEAIFNSVLKQMIKKVETEIQSYEDLITFAEMVSFGSNKVCIEQLDDTKEEEVFKNYLITLLKACAKITGTHQEIRERNLPVKITYTTSNLRGKYQTDEAHTFGNLKMPKRIHGRTWAMTHQKKYKHELIVDITKIFTKVFLYNTVENFLIKNQDLYNYKFALDFLQFSSNRKSTETGIVYVPEELDSRILILNTFKKYDLVGKDTVFEPSEGYDNYGTDILLGYNPETNSITNFNSSMYHIMLFELINQTVYIKDKVDRAIRETSDYARSFQTKKHINLKTQEVMKNNTFLQKYGYVELDNDVELDKFKVLEKEFEELSEKIYIPKCTDHSFRIKKLGKHKAAGLYYPAPVRATIFDLDYPTAYCHELGHQIDHVLLKDERGGMLSETVRFMRVIEIYKAVVNETVENLKDGSQFKACWKGKTKYNSSYYFLPTEIFARSFEMYLTHKDIKTSFLPEILDTPVYPMHDENLLKLISNYFDELFATYKAEEQVTNGEVPAKQELEQTEELQQSIDDVPTTTEVTEETTTDDVPTTTEVAEETATDDVSMITEVLSEPVKDTTKILASNSNETRDNTKSVKKTGKENNINTGKYEQLSLF